MSSNNSILADLILRCITWSEISGETTVGATVGVVSLSKEGEFAGVGVSNLIEAPVSVNTITVPATWVCLTSNTSMVACKESPPEVTREQESNKIETTRKNKNFVFIFAGIMEAIIPACALPCMNGRLQIPVSVYNCAISESNCTGGSLRQIVIVGDHKNGLATNDQFFKKINNFF